MALTKKIVAVATTWKAVGAMVLLLLSASAVWYALSQDRQCAECDCLYSKRDRLSSVVETLDSLSEQHTELFDDVMVQYRGGDMTEAEKREATVDLIWGIIQMFESSSREFDENRDIIITGGGGLTDTNVDAEIADFRKLMSDSLNPETVGETVLQDLYSGAQSLVTAIEEISLVAFLDTDGELRDACGVR